MDSEEYLHICLLMTVKILHYIEVPDKIMKFTIGTGSVPVYVVTINKCIKNFGITVTDTYIIGIPWYINQTLPSMFVLCIHKEKSREKRSIKKGNGLYLQLNALSSLSVLVQCGRFTAGYTVWIKQFLF